MLGLALSFDPLYLPLRSKTAQQLRLMSALMLLYHQVRRVVGLALSLGDWANLTNLHL